VFPDGVPRRSGKTALGVRFSMSAGLKGGLTKTATTKKGGEGTNPIRRYNFFHQLGRKVRVVQIGGCVYANFSDGTWKWKKKMRDAWPYRRDRRRGKVKSEREMI